MYTLHKEGRTTIALVGLGHVSINAAMLTSDLPSWLALLIAAMTTVILLLIINFFRIPKRQFNPDPNAIYAPADGKVVVIEEVFEPEYYQEKRLLISVFMSPLNVHNQVNPVSGIVKYFQYHPGKYLVAWHPKASEENERTSYVVETANGHSLLQRQIAGALAKRIKWYVKPGDKVFQCQEYGFIKFGSRADVYLPLGTPVHVKLGDLTEGGLTKLASWV